MRSRQTRNSECRGNFDVRIGGRFGAREGGSDFVGVGAASRRRQRNDLSGTRLGRMRPFGDDATSVGDGTAFSASNAGAATRCDARSNPARGDLASDNCASGFDVVGRLGRRRTSTVNEGTACLNVVLDTAHRSADLSCRRPCEAKRNKAIGDYRGKQTRQHRATSPPPRRKQLRHCRNPASALTRRQREPPIVHGLVLQ